MKICYDDTWRPNTTAQAMIAQAERICRDYARQGFDLTLRQLYYQFVAHDLFPDARRWTWTGSRWSRDPDGTKNAEPNYKWLGDLINKARLAGLLDWNYIVDRTRSLAGNNHWTSPGDIIRSAARGYGIDRWSDQPRRVEIWVEKEALAGIVAGVARDLDLDYFSCRGYVSQSELWRAGRRLGRYLDAGQAVTVLHLGDHDPSGIDMTRDIQARLETYVDQDHPGLLWRHDLVTDGLPNMEIRRIALNYDQVVQYNPPPNPTKLTDSRAGTYLEEHGTESWELDALDPTTLAALITDHVEGMRDDDLYEARVAIEEEHMHLLGQASARWEDVVAFLGGGR